MDTHTPTTPADDRDSAYVDAVLGGTGRSAGVSRKLVEELPLDSVMVVPEENYRWGSKEAMELDFARAEIREDGTVVNSFENLVSNIRELGVLNPCGVVLREDGKYHPIYGFTRCCAAKKAGLKTIPAYVYDSSITESQVELLQLHENAAELKREVNWVAELDGIDALVARFAIRFARENNVDPEKVPRMKGIQEAARLICKSAGTIRNRMTWRAHMDPRVVQLGREGRLSSSAAVLLTGEGSSVCANRYSKEFIGSVLKRLKLEDGTYPSIITAQAVRDAIRFVRVTASNRIAKEDKEQCSVVNNRIRQSPAVLRDISVMLARSMLRCNAFNLRSKVADVEKLVGSSHWFEIRGMGIGAGDAIAPPVLEKVIGGRGEDDDYVKQLDEQYERTCDTYATNAFIEAFMHDAMERLGVKYIGDAERAGWQAGKSEVKGRTVHHREAYRSAVRDAVALKDAPLLERARAAWKALEPVVIASQQRSR